MQHPAKPFRPGPVQHIWCDLLPSGFVCICSRSRYSHCFFDHAVLPCSRYLCPSLFWCAEKMFSLFVSDLWHNPMTKEKEQTNSSNIYVLRTFFLFLFLDEGFGCFWPRIRILREISSLEPDSQVWNRKSSLKNSNKIPCIVFILVHGVRQRHLSLYVDLSPLSINIYDVRIYVPGFSCVPRIFLYVHKMLLYFPVVVWHVLWFSYTYVFLQLSFDFLICSFYDMFTDFLMRSFDVVTCASDFLIVTCDCSYTVSCFLTCSMILHTLFYKVLKLYLYVPMILLWFSNAFPVRPWTQYKQLSKCRDMRRQVQSREQHRKRIENVLEIMEHVYIHMYICISICERVGKYKRHWTFERLQETFRKT